MLISLWSLLSMLVMLPVGVAFVRSGLRRPEAEHRWVVGTRWALWALVAGVVLTTANHILMMGYGPPIVGFCLGEVLLVALLGAMATKRRSPRVSYHRGAAAPATLVILSLAELPLQVSNTYSFAAGRTNFHPPDVSVASAVLVVQVFLFAAGTLALRNYALHRPRLVIAGDGLEYARDRHRVLRLPWHLIARIELTPLGDNGAPTLRMWPAPDTKLPRSRWTESLWRPGLGAYVITDLRRLGVKPAALAEAISRHSTGRLASDAPPLSASAT